MIVLKISSELLRTLPVVNTTTLKTVKYSDAITQVSRNDQMLLHISFNHVSKRAVLCLKDFHFLPNAYFEITMQSCRFNQSCLLSFHGTE